MKKNINKIESGPPKILAVVVTFNRLSKLKKSLYCLVNQSYSLTKILVVNNGSTDGTESFLKDWSNKNQNKRLVMNIKTNFGGSYGFYEGQKYGVQEGFDWLLLLDDDAYLATDYLKVLISNLNHITQTTSVICGAVYQFGNLALEHRTRLGNKWSRKFQIPVPLKDYNKDKFEFDFVSYVGALINTDALKTVGLVDKDFFIWYDDTEHSMRLRKYGNLICVPKAKVVHDISEERDGYSWKTFYGFRNNVLFLRKHFKIQFPFIVIITLIKAALCPLKGRSFTEMKARILGVWQGILGKKGKNQSFTPRL